MKYAICIVGAGPVRKEDAHRSEMVNQLLFGEIMEILETKGDWFRIRSLYDDYEGWITYHLVSEIDKNLALNENLYVATGLLNQVHYKDQIIHIPLGSSLNGFSAVTKQLWNNQYRYNGEFTDLKLASKNDLLKIASLWMNAPYLWGGKTFMGVDCSGFAQTVFKMAGIKLKRDAWQQAEEGIPVDKLSDAKQGDLGFYCNEAGRVTHVGILMNNNQVIHASGKVRIDSVDEAGIYNHEIGKRTHSFHSIRRYF